MKGIYKICNLVNNKVYIGQSVDIESRRVAHIEALRSQRHYNDHLNKSFKKYGESSFEFTIIEECEDLDIREVYWILYYRSIEAKFGYNYLTGGTKFKMNDETKAKISKGLNEFWKSPLSLVARKSISLKTAGKNNSFYGKKHTKETIDKIIKHHTGIKQSQATKDLRRKWMLENSPNRGKTFSDEYRKKLSESHKGNIAKNLMTFGEKETEAIIKLYQDGEKTADIGIKYKCSSTPILKLLKANNIALEKASRKNKIIIETNIEEIKKMRTNGMTFKELGEYFSMNKTTFSKYYKKLTN